jgi:HEPN domain-containing protein
VRDVSSPSPEQVEYAEVLLRRAKGDLQACRALADDTDIDDNIVGFHAQQAVEKALKVALVLADADLPLSHDLGFLVRQVRESGFEPPKEFSDVQWLTPWAAELRYDEPIALDRTAALAAAERAVGWAVSLLEDPASGVSSDKTREEISGGSLPGDQS